MGKWWSKPPMRCSFVSSVPLQLHYPYRMRPPPPLCLCRDSTRRVCLPVPVASLPARLTLHLASGRQRNRLFEPPLAISIPIARLALSLYAGILRAFLIVSG